MYIYNTTLYYIHRSAAAEAVSMRVTVNLSLFSSDCHYPSLSLFFHLFENRENTIMKFCKKYICGSLPFAAIEVYPTMTTSTVEEARNVRKVHYCDGEANLSAIND